MSEDITFDGKTVVITGAGNGLGRAYALLFARLGARVVVNDFGCDSDGFGVSKRAADQVVSEISSTGGEAVANYDSVEDGDKIIDCALDQFGRVDALINNAGILRDRAFHNMSDDDWDQVYKVHVWGAFKTTRAAWPHMRAQQYGRVVFTSSASGVHGNFGQANYAMAKLGLHGLAQTLAIEGKARNIFVNSVAPIAGSRLLEGLLPSGVTKALKPELVSPLVAYLCHQDCTASGHIFEAGAGWFSRLCWKRARGLYTDAENPASPGDIAENWGQINDFEQSTSPSTVLDSYQPLLKNLPEEDAKQWIALMQKT